MIPLVSDDMSSHIIVTSEVYNRQQLLLLKTVILFTL